MMSFIGSCMTWVPIVWGQVRGLFASIRTVDNLLHDVIALSDLQAVGDPAIPHLPLGDGHLYDLPAVDNSLPDLPYHIITDILSRLPAKCVFQCQSVSKLLHVLTTTPFFIHAHHNRATSIMALQSCTQSSDRYIKLYFIEEKSEKIEAISMKLDFCYMRRGDPIMLYGSCDGFLLFRNYETFGKHIFFISNPITKQQVTLTSPCLDMYVCGFYFHPLEKEYQVLYLYKNGPQSMEFHILSLQSKSWSNIGNWSYPPSRVRPPIIINSTLHWMIDGNMYSSLNDIYPSCSHSIVSFNIESKEFRTLRHGGPLCSSPYQHSRMQLLEMEGQLGLCETYHSSTQLVLWILHHPTNYWVKRYTIILPSYDVHQYFSILPNKFNVEIVQIRNGELFLRQKNRLLVYNLKLGVYRLVEKKGFEGDNFRAMIHTHSLVSLNTDNVICLPRS